MHIPAVLMLSIQAAVPEEFVAAEPVWLEGRETEMNVQAGFRAIVEAPAAEEVTLRVTASSIYRAFVNGRFAGHGPARAGHGYYRVDEWDITGLVEGEKAVVAIEVAGYNVNSYYLLDQPSFLQAEVTTRDRVLAATGHEARPFEARHIDERVQKVQRYSYQRPFIELYRLTPEHDAWRLDPDASFVAQPLAVAAEKRLLTRHVPYPRFPERPAKWHVAKGVAVRGAKPDAKWRNRGLRGFGPDFKGYPPEELVDIPSDELIRTGWTEYAAIGQPLPAGQTLDLSGNVFHIVDYGANMTGFIGAHVTCGTPCRLFLMFDEILTGEGDVDWTRMGSFNAVVYDLEPGEYRVESIEPYTLRYMKLAALDGDCRVDGLCLRAYENTDVWEAHFACNDDRYRMLFEAGRATYAQNATDIFMDCPSRERAGWLCDSFFTARVALDLSGDTRIEDAFLENLLLPDKFEHLPGGMLPMCYPSEHYDGNFIPNWALWFVVQLEEYQARSGNDALVQALEPKVMALFDYFEPFKNEDGLLEKLDGWVFVEWSMANRFVQDVNYPSNMVYAGALDAAGRLYGREDLCEQAREVRRTIRAQSWDGEFFVDNALRKDGKLEVTRNRSETCQYYAFFFDVANPETHPELWVRLRDEFGPDREEKGAWPEVHPANAFIGNMLRFELLSRYGRMRQILAESIGYLLYMAERTGTLWENELETASCNHGFASHIVHTLYRDVAGIYHLDPVNRRVVLRFGDLPLQWCEGRRPLGEGAVEVQWWRAEDGLHYNANVPAGFALEVENLSGLELITEPQRRVRKQATGE